MPADAKVEEVPVVAQEEDVKVVEEMEVVEVAVKAVEEVKLEIKEVMAPVSDGVKAEAPAVA